MVSGPKSYKSKNVQNTNQGVPKPNQNSLQLKGSVDIVPERWNQTLCSVQEKNTNCSIIVHGPESENLPPPREFS